MNAESVWMSGPSLSQSFDTNVEPYLETSECEPVAGKAATQSPTPVRKCESWLDRVMAKLFIKPTAVLTIR